MKYTTEKYRTAHLECVIEQPDVPVWETVITATFVSPSEKEIVREAYWDGENHFKVAYMTDEEGTWTYTVRHGNAVVQSGSIECVPYTGNLDLYRHGFIRVSENGKYFTYADGTPFVWLGDTHWEFAYRETWDSNYPKMDSMFMGMADKRVAQGFNVYQTNLRADTMFGGRDHYFDGDKPNVAFYQNELDRRMQYLADCGLINAIGLTWHMDADDGIDHLKQLARYIVNRYGSLPLVYTLVGEVAGYDPEKRQKRIDTFNELAKYIERIDPYHHLKTAHYTNERPFASYYQDEPWHSFTLNQAGHGDYIISVNDYTEYLEQYGNKPFVEGEAMYEFVSTLEEMGSRLCTADLVRRVAYTTMQVGGAGYTYGAQGIWDCVLEKGKQHSRVNIFNRFDVTWYEAVEGEGATQMGYLKEFYLKQKFWQLHHYKTAQESNLFNKKSPLVLVNDDNSKAILYYFDGCRKQMTMPLANGTYQVTKFDPRTNAYMRKEDVSVQTGEWMTPKKEENDDYLVVLEKIK
ncbi:MAG: DUF4038 domain-containing protein [Erysipelotrichaceae bacterium]|nr:DUF4038 domain-containing protein [Erysipelotrichaceae bacterium]